MSRPICAHRPGPGGQAPSSPPWDAAVIGSGFSGTAVAIHLARGLPAGASLLLLEQAGVSGRGLAYAAHCASHWLNVPAGRLGLDPQDEGGFLRWLAGRRPGVRGGDFVPRALMGDYLGEHLHQALEQARQRGVRVEQRTGQALDLLAPDTPGGPWQITLDNTAPQPARQVVLATGFGAPTPPALPGGLGWDAPGLVAAPLAPQALDGIGELDDVLILGSGLTAVDVITALQDRGHLGRIQVLSRRGLWPRPHRPLEARPVAGEPALARLEAATGLAGLLRAVRGWIRDGAAQGQDWRDVMASLRPATPALWQRLSPRERRQFLRHLAPWWDVHRHRMAPGIHARLQAEFERGRLRSAAGRLTAVEAWPQGLWRIRWTPRGTDASDHPAKASADAGRAPQAMDPAPQGGRAPQVQKVQQEQQVRAILNCTGAATRLDASHSPLLGRLHARGLLCPDALGLGLLTDERLRPLDAGGRAQAGLHYVGPMLRAQHWEAIAIPELREHARSAADAVLDALAA